MFCRCSPDSRVGMVGFPASLLKGKRKDLVAARTDDDRRVKFCPFGWADDIGVLRWVSEWGIEGERERREGHNRPIPATLELTSRPATERLCVTPHPPLTPLLGVQMAWIQRRGEHLQPFHHLTLTHSLTGEHNCPDHLDIESQPHPTWQISQNGTKWSSPSGNHQYILSCTNWYPQGHKMDID